MKKLFLSLFALLCAFSSFKTSYAIAPHLVTVENCYQSFSMFFFDPTGGVNRESIKLLNTTEGRKITIKDESTAAVDHYFQVLGWSLTPPYVKEPLPGMSNLVTGTTVDIPLDYDVVWIEPLDPDVVGELAVNFVDPDPNLFSFPGFDGTCYHGDGNIFFANTELTGLCNLTFTLKSKPGDPFASFNQVLGDGLTGTTINNPLSPAICNQIFYCWPSNCVANPCRTLTLEAKIEPCDPASSCPPIIINTDVKYCCEDDCGACDPNANCNNTQN